MIWFLMNQRQRDILCYLFSAPDIYEARARFSEDSLIRKFAVSKRTIKTDRHELFYYNPDNPVLPLLRTSRKKTSSENESLFRDTAGAPQKYVLIGGDAQRIFIGLNFLSYSYTDSFTYQEFNECLTILPILPSSHNALDSLRLKCMDSDLIVRDSTKSGKYFYRFPRTHTYTSPALISHYLNIRLHNDLIDEEKIRTAEYLEQYLLLALSSNSRGGSDISLNPFSFYAPEENNKCFASFLNWMKTMDFMHHSLHLVINREPLNSFSLERIIYSVEKDDLYLSGFTQKSAADYSFSIISYHTINRLKSYENKDENAVTAGIVSTPSGTYDEMLAVSYDKAQSVVVKILPYAQKKDGSYFYRNLLEKFNAITQKRPATASLKAASDNSYNIYRDTIRGEDDFLRFIRSNGNQLIILSPDSMRSKMAASAKSVIQMYDPARPASPSDWYYDATVREAELEKEVDDHE